MGAGASGGGDMGPGVDDGIGGFAGLGPVGGNIDGQGHGSPRKSVDDAVYDAPFNLGQNPFGIAQPGQPVSTISSLVSQLVAPSMVTHNLPTFWSPDAVPTMNPRDEMGAWSGLVYDSINNPGQAVVDALQNKAAGAVLGVPGAVIGGLRSFYDALTSKQNPAPVESVNVTGGGSGGSGSTSGYGQKSIFGGVNVDQIGMNRSPNNNRAVIDALQEGAQSANFNTNAISQAGGDPRLAEARRVAEQRAAESMLAGFQPQGNTSGPMTITVPSTEEGEPGIEVIIPVDDTVDDTTVVTKKPVKKPRNPRRTRPVRRPSKAKTIAKSLSKPKAFKKLPKFAQKQLRRGVVPTTGSDHVQDMVRAFLGGQETVGDSGTRK